MDDKKHKLEKFFNPQSIAVVGASEKEEKVGGIIAKNLLHLGYAGKIFWVNPKHQKLFGEKCYASLEEINESVDLAIIAIPAIGVNDLILRVAEKIKNFVIISSGFSETGEEGKMREMELEKIAEEKNLLILGPNCLGFLNPALKLNASFATGLPAVGSLAFLSQSGALAVALADMAARERIGFSQIISLGNKVQLEEADVLEYLAEDEKTRAVAVYMEGIKDGHKFLDRVSAIAAKKPIIVLKPGHTEKSRQAAASHTGALAGSEEIFRAAFEKSGVIQADNLDNFFALIKIALTYGKIKNNQIIVVTNAGGPGVLTADAFVDREIELAEISLVSQEKLKTFLPAESSLKNPIDLLGDAREDRWRKTFEVLATETADTVICVLTRQDQTPAEAIAEEIIKFQEKTGKKTVAVFIGGESLDQARDILRSGNIADFNSPETAVEALDQYFHWSQWSERQIEETLKEKMKKIDFFSANKERRKKASLIIQKALAEKRKVLFFAEAAALVKLYKINPVSFFTAFTVKELTDQITQFPVVLKIDSEHILHKTDKQGVVLNIENSQQLEEAAQKMRKNFPKENLLVQPMLPIQTELILGIKRDSVFGLVAVLGLGGIYTEIFKKADFFLPPLNREEAQEKISAGSLGFLFKETRGKKSLNIEEIFSIIENLIFLGEENLEIAEIDINPLLVYNDGRKAEAADIKIILR